MITGGLPSKVGQHVELLFHNGTHLCELESLPKRMSKHSQSGLIACGGTYTEFSCFKFSGNWKAHGQGQGKRFGWGTRLLHSRVASSSWTWGDQIMLIGGAHSPMKTETVSIDEGLHHPSFNLIHSTRYKTVDSPNFVPSTINV